MSGWDWLPVGLAAWFLVAVAVAFAIGPVLARRSAALEEPDGEEDPG